MFRASVSSFELLEQEFEDTLERPDPLVQAFVHFHIVEPVQELVRVPAADA